MNTTYLAFGMPGGMELIIIFGVVLLLFGAKKIPELARGVGKGMGEFKKAKKDFDREIRAGEEEGEKEWDSKMDEHVELDDSETSEVETPEEETPEN